MPDGESSEKSETRRLSPRGREESECGGDARNGNRDHKQERRATANPIRPLRCVLMRCKLLRCIVSDV